MDSDRKPYRMTSGRWARRVPGGLVEVFKAGDVVDLTDEEARRIASLVAPVEIADAVSGVAAATDAVDVDPSIVELSEDEAIAAIEKMVDPAEIDEAWNDEAESRNPRREVLDACERRSESVSRG